MTKPKEIKTLDDLTPDAENFNRHTEFGQKLLEDSLRKFGAGRSVLVDKDGNIIAGNGVVETAAAIGMEDVVVVKTDGKKLVVVQRDDLTLDSPEGRELALADNMTALKGIDIDLAKVQETLGDDMAKAWGMEFEEVKDKEEKVCLCNLKEQTGIFSYGSFSVIVAMRKSDEGKPLAEIKGDDANVFYFASVMEVLIKKTLRNVEKFALICGPKRRHKEHNFATMVSQELSNRLMCHFYEDAVTCRTRARILPDFTLEKEITEDCVIVYDDIITTGSTMKAINELLQGKTIVNFATILNT